MVDLDYTGTAEDAEFINSTLADPQNFGGNPKVALGWLRTVMFTKNIDPELVAPVPEWMQPRPVIDWDEDAVVAFADKLGRKFEAGDMDDGLIAFAFDWVENLPANENFGFLLDIRLKIVTDEITALTAGQAKGVLNCLVPRVRREREAENKPLPVEPELKAPVAAPKNEAAEDGIYVRDGKTYKVKRSVSSGFPYALELDTETGKFDIAAKGMQYRLRADERMTEEQMKNYSEIYGRCINCGRELSNEDSIERAMGPICYGRMGF